MILKCVPLQSQFSRVLEVSRVQDINTPTVDDTHELMTEVAHLIRAIPKLSQEKLPSDFKNRILRNAFLFFGTVNITTWFNFQEVTDYHHRFLDDTLHFIKWRNRLTSHTTYQSIFLGYHKRTQKTAPISRKDYLPKMVYRDKNRVSVTSYLPSKTAELLALWTTTDAGYIDLLASLHIMLADYDSMDVMGELQSAQELQRSYVLGQLARQRREIV